MRKLNQNEINAVSGALTADQITYFATVSAQAFASFTFQVGLKAMGITAPGISLNYIAAPVLNLLTGAITTEACNQYFAGSK